MAVRRLLRAGLVLLAGGVMAPLAAAAGAAAVQGPGVLGQPSGTGPWPAVAEAVADLPQATLYHPQQPGREALPLLLWGNGGCRDNGLRYAQFLREVASHGFFVIAAGHPRQERPVRPPGAAAPADEGNADGRADLPVLRAALDWALRSAADPGSPFRGRFDTTRIGVMGTSCGGLQAIALATDARVKTAIAFNSGVLITLPATAEQNRDLVVPKSALADLKGPIAYINGGPTDIAYENALDDLQRITHVPVFFAENGVGHGGTYLFDAHGGEYARVATAWFGWHLKGDADAARWFQGADCRLCTQPGWSVRRKQFGTP